MIKEMGEEHIEPVSSIHAASWNPSEISVKLGKEFLQLLYMEVVKSDKAFGLVYEGDCGIVGYCTGFFDYDGFSMQFKNRHLLRLFKIVLLGFLWGRLGYSDILCLLKDREKTKKCKCPGQHLGALAISKEYKGTKSGLKAFFILINSVLNRLSDKGFKGCWASCDGDNISICKFLERCGFDKVDEFACVSKKVAVYEILFEKNKKQA